MIALRIILALITVPFVMFATLNTPKWLEVVIVLACVGLALGQLFYPALTRYLLISFAAALLLQALLGTNNSTSWH